MASKIQYREAQGEAPDEEGGNNPNAMYSDGDQVGGCHSGRSSKFVTEM